MPVINVFQPGAQLGAPADSKAQFKADSSGAMAAARQDTNIANTIVEGGNKLYEQMAVADVMAANNTINQRMNEVRNKLLQNKEQNAFGNMQTYEDERKKIIDEVVSTGPASLRTGIGNRALMTTLDKDWTSRKDFMERYQYGEIEKYQDTQLGNQYRLTLSEIPDVYTDSNLIKERLRRGGTFAAARFANYGPERVAAEQARWRSAAAGTAVQAALAADNYERAGELLQEFGNDLEPTAKMKMDKLIQEHRKSDDQILTFADIYKRHGNDLEAGLAEIRSKTGLADVDAGVRFASDELGKQYGVNNCANFVSSVITAAGGSDALKSSLADGMYRNAEEQGLSFTDRNQLRDGDVVYWNPSGSGYTASDDPKDVSSDSKAYMGITHVGVYDAKTGKVIQSGTSGVAAIDIDAYKVVGFSHIGGRQLSPTEQQQRLEAYRTYYVNQTREKRLMADARFNDWSKNLFAWKDEGVSWDQALKKAEQWAGNDLELLRDVRSAVQDVYKVSSAPGSNGSGGGLDPGIKNGIEHMIGTGQFSRKQDMLSFAAGMNATKAEYNALSETYDKWTDGKGEYAYSWSSIKEEVMDGSRLKDGAAEAQWNGAMASGKMFIKDYIMKNHRQPTDYEVIDHCRRALTVTHYGSYVTDYGMLWNSTRELTLSDAQLARAGIKSVEKVSDDMYEITYADGTVGGAVNGAYLVELTSYEGR